MGIPKTRKRLPLSVMAFLIVLGIVAALNGAHVAGRLLLATTARRAVVEEGTVTLGFPGEAVLLRRELVIVAPEAGIWHPQVSRGQQVTTGTSIGELVDAGQLDQARQLQEKVKGAKAVWESDIMAKKQQLQKSLDEINEKVPELLVQLKNDLAKMQTAQAQQLNDRLQEMLRQRGCLLVEKEQLDQEAISGGAWRQIEAEAKELMAQATNIVVTPMTGRFEDRLDGYEDVFDPLEFKTALVPLTPSGTVSAYSVPAGEHVDQGQILGKVIQEEPTFAQVRLDEKLDTVALNDQVGLHIKTAQIQLQGMVVALAHEENENIIVLKLFNAPPAISSVREIEVEVILDQVCGAVVPEQALIRLNGQEGVYCWQGDRWIFKPVEVMALDQGQAIVTGIRPGDEISLGLRF